MNRIILLLILTTCLGCFNTKVFNQAYKFEKDPFIPIYQEELVSIVGENFDSNQVSNKTLDPEMIHAVHQVNLILGNPEKYAPFLKNRIEKLGITKITLASAARSAYLQERLTAKYKASYLKSYHLFGLAVDLEMKGKPFDIKSHPNDPKILENYKTLGMVLELAGLVFSEPVSLDPNHVELFRYCKKKNPNYDQKGLREKKLIFYTKMRDLCYQKLENASEEKNIKWNQLLNDLLYEIKELDRV